MKKNNTIAILGDGGWGTALAVVLARKGLLPTLWGAFPEYLKSIEQTKENKKFLPGITLPDQIRFSSNIQDVVSAHDIIVLAVPTKYVRSVLGTITDCQLKDKIIVSVTKGIENNTLFTVSEIIRELLGPLPVVILSGPSHAEEVASNIPTCTVASSKHKNNAQTVQELFTDARFRVYTSQDTIGVELGGALKNVIAIAAGICDGLQFGANTKAALLSRGLQEMVRLGVNMGAQAETFFGLSGLGDLVTTCISAYGRNRKVGELIGRGKKIRDIVSNMEMVAEGVDTARSAYDLSRKHTVEMPIITEVYRILYEEKDPLQSISDLMLRDSKDEM